MTELELRPYARLYRSAPRMGAATLFRQFFGLPGDAVVPLSVAHGVDFGHCHRPMDVTYVEPVHWSCNPAMHQAAMACKPSLLLPHPWTMHVAQREIGPGRGVLLIGPPPSPENDAALLELIKDDIRDDWSILVKARGAYEGSMRFWERAGVRPLTASGPDATFYPRLATLLAQFDTIVGCTFSSALVFAASIGRRVRLVHGYSYRLYEVMEYETQVNFASEQGRAVVRTFAQEDDAAIGDLSRHLLGFDQVARKDAALREFRALVASLERPFWNNPALRLPYRLREAAAMALGRPNLLTAELRTYPRHLLRTNVCVMQANDLDVWMNGKTPHNFSLTPIPYVRGQTEPGTSPGSYPAAAGTAPP